MSLSLQSGQTLVLELSAVIVAVTEDEPRVLVVQRGEALPAGPLEPDHRTLELGLRAWVERQTGQKLGYVEQLYTFADRDRITEVNDVHVISLSYLALAREASVAAWPDAGWQNWYSYFPWEDRRSSNPVTEQALPLLQEWAESVDDGPLKRRRLQRIAETFGQSGRSWNEEMTLQRFELLYEAGLVGEAARAKASLNPTVSTQILPGLTMVHDHRRILATGIARLRAKIKYRPVVFELMPESFALSQLQRAVEALAGRPVHTQNFRRSLQQQKLVEETGARTSETGGRPAKLMRFRHELLRARAVAGTKLPLAPTA